MGIVRVALAQKHVGFIEKKQSVLVIRKLKMKRKLPLELCYIAAQIPLLADKPRFSSLNQILKLVLLQAVTTCRPLRTKTGF